MKKEKWLIVTNRHLCHEKNLTLRIEKILKGEVCRNMTDKFTIKHIILREKDLTKEDYTALAMEIGSICKRYNINFYVNTYWDIGESVGARGVQLPFRTFLNLKSNDSFLSNLKMGVSVHSLDEAIKAERLGAEYLLFGHMFHTDCKKDLKPRGLYELKSLVSAVHIPVYAIGGINIQNYRKVLQQGACGIATMSGAMMDE